MGAMLLRWLPVREGWDELLRSVKDLPAGDAAARLRELAESRLEFSQVVRLDRTAQKLIARDGGLGGFEKVKLAVLGSSTTAHLIAGIRVAGLRRGLQLDVFEAEYGSYQQELMEPSSRLHAFYPEVILLALDARHLAGGRGASVEGAIELMRDCWSRAKSAFHCQVLQQTVLPVFPNLLGNNEERMTASPAAVVAGINERLRETAAAAGVDLLAVDRVAAVDGIAQWHDAGLWLHAKQEVHPRVAEMYGEQVARLIAAGRGKSKKCLVLDLDNTLWGGVVGDDGVEGIVLGQGSALGEAFVEFQRYARGLSERGVLLAVCSKNDEANAMEPFVRHPEMVLKSADIACFVANWTDKAANLREIARRLNIGLDALVFVDDNPVERALIRRELPMVAVPEMPLEAAEFAAVLSAAGYFEGLCTTEEDRARGEMYQANAERESLRETTTDMASYLESLRMRMIAGPVDEMSLARVTQLINKTNQFNLTTVRLSEAEVCAAMRDPKFVTLQVRLEDRFGDNGIIAVLLARVNGADAVIEEWLMSCRVLGRRVEEACLNVLTEACAAHGVKRLVGVYRPTEKNSMVREMYAGLGFVRVSGDASGETTWELALGGFEARVVPIQVEVLREALV
jgi:FkbH-like protein